MAGAGLAGLATAAALAQRGWSVRLHEQGPELREIGAGIYLFDNALRALEAIGAYDDVAARAEDVREMELRDHRNELVRGGHHHGVGGRTCIALRRDLHAALVKAAVAAGVEIVTSSRALAADPGGRLEFEHGFGDRADLVVGTDGVYSAVRDSLRLATSIVDLQDGCGRHLIPRGPDDPVQRTIETSNDSEQTQFATTCSGLICASNLCGAEPEPNRDVASANSKRHPSSRSNVGLTIRLFVNPLFSSPRKRPLNVRKWTACGTGVSRSVILRGVSRKRMRSILLPRNIPNAPNCGPRLDWAGYSTSNSH